jgi:hypothetical protein
MSIFAKDFFAIEQLLFFLLFPLSRSPPSLFIVIKLDQYFVNISPVSGALRESAKIEFEAFYSV